MCTVTYVCSNNKIIITSNRDEQVLRPAAAPNIYRVNTKNIIFPKDTRAGGTWYAIDEEANVIVLLNGASEKHEWNPPYGRSRGLILLDIIGSEFPLSTWETIDLNTIEPFTLVLYQAKKLYQLRWNGTDKETVALNEKKHYIWSSSTLYSKVIREKRSEWFCHFTETKPEISEEELFHFHRYTEDGNVENGLIINRNEKLKTLSITQTVIEKNKIAMIHHDLIKKNKSDHSFLTV